MVQSLLLVFQLMILDFIATLNSDSGNDLLPVKENFIILGHYNRASY